jgi:hypothetical protein
MKTTLFPLVLLTLLCFCPVPSQGQTAVEKPCSGPVEKMVFGDISPPWLQNTAPNCIAFRPGAPDRIFLGSVYDGLLFSTDGGANWHREYIDFYIDEYTPSWWIRDVLFSEQNPMDGIAVTMAGTYWTSDGGATWYAFSWPCPTMSHMAINSPDGNAAVVSDYTGNLWIYDWNTRTFDMPISVPGAPSCFGISFDQSSPPLLWIASTNRSVWKSPDMGQTLIQFNAGLPASVVVVVADPVLPGRALAAAGPDLFTTDSAKKGGGRKPVWFPTGAGLPGTTIHSLIHDPVDPKRVFAGTQDFGIFISIDRGATWNPLTRDWMTHMNIVDLGINPERPGFLLAAGHSGSPDAGGLYKIPIRRP